MSENSDMKNKKIDEKDIIEKGIDEKNSRENKAGENGLNQFRFHEKRRDGEKITGMKKNFDNIKIPEQLNVNVERMVEKAKNEKKNSREEEIYDSELAAADGQEEVEIADKQPHDPQKDSIRSRDRIKKSAAGIWIRGTVLTAAAAMLAITVLANANTSIAHAMEQIPILGAITKVVTFRTYEDKNDFTAAKINIPKVTELPDKKTEEELNKKISDYSAMIIQRYESDVKELEGGHEAVNSDYEVITDNEKLFSMRINTTINRGSSENFSKFYNVNKETGTIMELKDLFLEGSDYVATLSNHIKEQMKEQMIEQPGKYFLDSDIPEFDFKHIKEHQNFYINPSGSLVIAFDKYEVSPGYIGMPEFEIPLEVVSGILANSRLLN